MKVRRGERVLTRRATELHLGGKGIVSLGSNIIVTFGTGGWLVEPNREKLLKLSRISFATYQQQVAFICANVQKVAIQKSSDAQCNKQIRYLWKNSSHLDYVIHKVSPHVTEVVKSLLGNLPIIRMSQENSNTHLKIRIRNQVSSK